MVIDHDHCYFSQNIQINNVPLPLIHQTNDVPEITENFIGQMNVKCTHCKAKRVANKGDSFNDCCNHGNVELLLAPEFPIELKKLFDSEQELSPQFFQSIRLYNNLFPFASFNENLVNFIVIEDLVLIVLKYKGKFIIKLIRLYILQSMKIPHMVNFSLLMLMKQLSTE